MNVGILGCGTVGSGVLDLLIKNQLMFERRYLKKIRVKHVLVKHIDKHSQEKLLHRFTTDYSKIAEDDEIDVIIEAIGGIYPAYEYVLDSLKKKRHVITANKELISSHGKELTQIAEENGVLLLYEASVAGAIPIIHAISNGLSGDDVTEIVSIINGTTNFILTSMKHNKASFIDSLEYAKKLGYAESCSDVDISGLDSARKLAILCLITYGIKIDVKDIETEGITKIRFEDILVANQLGYEIKLLALCKKVGHQLSTIVAPFMIDKREYLARVDDVFNAVVVKCDAADELIFIGKGAGKYPTASAIIGNLAYILSDNKNYFYDEEIACSLEVQTEDSFQYCIILDTLDKEINEGIITTMASDDVKTYRCIDDKFIVFTKHCNSYSLNKLLNIFNADLGINNINFYRIYGDN